MKRVTATEGRRLLFKLLDEVENGTEVVLERRGVTFRLCLDAVTESAVRTPPPFIVEDPDLLECDWTWVADDEGQLGFQRQSE